MTLADEPDLVFEAYDGSFAEVLGADARLVPVIGVDAHDGPVYVADEDALYFTTVPRPSDLPAPGSPDVAIKRLALDGDRFPLEPERVSVLLPHTNAASGMTLDADGRLLICQQGTRAGDASITRIDLETGHGEIVVEGQRGLPLNSPSDVVVHSDGTIWFTDPSYGRLQGFRPEPLLGDHVYRYDERLDRLIAVADCFDKPNGLAFSPDERVLYVTDTGANREPGSYDPARPHHILAFDVDANGRLGVGRLFAVTTPGFPDGIKVDREGRVYASAFSGVQVFTPAGDLIGEIRLPRAVNFTFGGHGRNVLFITTGTAIWAAVLQATGPDEGG
jgi:gluconolactonase